MGENAITVSYAGAANENYRALPSQANETVTVNPIAVKMQYDTIQQTVAYTGLKQNCFVSTVNIVRTDNGKTVDSQVKPEVFYRQDGKNVVPVQPGSYEVWFKVTGNQYDVIEEKSEPLPLQRRNHRFALRQRQKTVIPYICMHR